MFSKVFSNFCYISQGPHLLQDGSLDERVWFSIPIELNTREQAITYLVFPHGAEEYEMEEVVVDVRNTEWTG